MPAVFQPTGSFNLVGVKATAESDVDITFRLTTNAKCPGNSNAALQPQLSLLRRNCDGSIRRGAAPRALDSTTAVCTGDGVFKAKLTAPFIRGDACFAIHIRLADGTQRMAIVAYE
jgi:hypothetical protein